jgi:hypothetical protein
MKPKSLFSIIRALIFDTIILARDDTFAVTKKLLQCLHASALTF